MSKVKKEVPLYDVPYGSKIYFPDEDSYEGHDRKRYYVRKTDGMYTQLFLTMEDLEKFERVGYVMATTMVVIDTPTQT